MSYRTELIGLLNQSKKLLETPDSAAARAMPCRTYFLEDGQVLALPRDGGDSRYPYGQDGFNFWAYASGYMHCNEGLFSLFLRATEGQEPKAAFFAGLPGAHGSHATISILPVPCLEGAPAVERMSILGMNAAYYIADAGDLVFGLRVFVNEQRRICFSLLADNVSSRPQTFFLSSFLNPYFRHQIYESGEDRWFKEVRSLPASSGGADLGPFMILVNEDKDRHSSITQYGVLQRSLRLEGAGRLLRKEETTSRYRYVGGVRRNLENATALKEGTFGSPLPVTTFTDTALAADMLHLELEPGACARLDFVLTHAPDSKAAEALAGRVADAEEIDADLQRMRESEAERQRGLSIRVAGSRDKRFKPAVFNFFFEHLKKQVEFCSLIKGYVQLSENSLIGIRDVFQSLEGLSFWQPAAARRKMIEALGFTAPDGRCFRQYSLPNAAGEPGRMDLRPFIDQGAWVISCVATYLRLSGDWALLKEVCGYHEIVNEAARKVAPSAQRDSVLIHLIKIMDYLLKNRDPETRCVMALYGDWNDALDGLGISRDPSKTYGTGVSVMATLQVYRNLGEMIELLGESGGGKYGETIRDYRQAMWEIEEGLKHYAVVADEQDGKKILHGWGDGRSYLVGSYRDPDDRSRDGLTSNAFWVLSGLLEKDASMGPAILKALERLDSKYGYKTFEPGFPPDTPGVGRIGKLPIGTAENAATYVHATIFAVMALFKMGQPRLAWEQLAKTLPFTELHQNLSHSPFVMPNAYGFNPEKGIDGQNMNDWQTGSSNVLLKLLVRFVFGVEPAMDGVWIQPASWSPFKSYEFGMRVRGCDLKIVYEDQDRKTRSFMVNGAVQKGIRDDFMGVDKLWIPGSLLDGKALEIKVMQ